MAGVFADSWERLEWVKYLANKIKPIVRHVSALTDNAPVFFETRVMGEYEHARYLKEYMEHPPPAVGFTIADIAVNARSCLDMVIQQMVSELALDIRHPQFPIEDNISERTSRSTNTLLNKLPEEIANTIIALQPDYQTSWGRADIPDNQSALMIRDVSNANKHRNITPVIHYQSTRGFMDNDGIGATLVAESESWWLDGKPSVLEIRYPKGIVSADQLANINPFAVTKLIIDQSGLKYEGLDLEVPIDVMEFLETVPLYTEYSLAKIEEAFRRYEPGTFAARHNSTVLSSCR